MVAQGAPPRGELAYAENIVGQTPITTVADITGLTITFTVANRPVKVEAFLSGVFNATTGNGAHVYITDNAGTQIQVAEVGRAQTGGGYGDSPYPTVVLRTPGSYTCKVRVAQAPSGNVTVGGGATQPNFIRAIEQ